MPRGAPRPDKLLAPPTRTDMTTGNENGEPLPWQLEMFSRSLKKRQKLESLLRLIGPTTGKRCLLVTNGDNSGALNVHFRRAGGDWTWVENESAHLDEMAALLAEPVLHGGPEAIPVESSSQDVVVSIDVHEHLDDCAPFNRELSRVVRPGGLVVVSTPNGDSRKPVTRLKRLVGMSEEQYGHKVIGYTIPQHEEMLRSAGMEPLRSSSYSGFFTETIELGINFLYVKILGKRAGAEVGTIAPVSGSQLRAVGLPYRLYSLLFPLLLLISRLDRVLSFGTGYAVSVAARRPP
jgi:SAM-dependent methyltransferase